MKYFIIFNVLIFFSATFYGCSDAEKKKETDEPGSADVEVVSSIPFGEMPDGREVTKYTLKNKNGMEMSVINYGGIVTSIKVPDKNGTLEEVTLGFDSLAPYLGNDPFFGALIGRYGNRIAKGEFSLGGTTYTLPINNAPNHLHGGPNGYYTVYWDIELLDNTSLKLTYLSKDGEAGYPGNLDIAVTYTLTDNNKFIVSYKATTDQKTVVNLTQHTYFNLSGNLKQDILDHQLMMKADKFLPADSVLIPTGELRLVDGTPFDFRELTAIGSRIETDNQQLAYGRGYDHCWVFPNESDELRKVAALYEPESGRRMEVLTTEPGIQFYSGNFLDGRPIEENGTVFNYRTGLCLETQHFPDAPNQPAFPSTVLEPGDTYQTKTVYQFSVKE